MPITAQACSEPRRPASTHLRLGTRASSPSRRAFLKSSAGVLLVSGMSSSLLCACGGGNLNVDQPETPRLASANNFRDVAGAAAGYPTVDGKQMRRGVFYRANALALSDADLVTITNLGIAAFYDLRTPGEVARTADVLPGGADVQPINVLGERDFIVPPMDAAAAASAFMENEAREFVTGPAQRAGFGELLNRLANNSGAQLFHSTAGKDRTGWVAALLQSIANVPLDVIMQDYLLSNVYSAPSINAQIQTLRTQDGDAIATIQAPIFSVQENYLQAGFDQVQAHFGTMANYLSQGLGLSQTAVDTLRSRLVI